MTAVSVTDTLAASILVLEAARVLDSVTETAQVSDAKSSLFRLETSDTDTAEVSVVEIAVVMATELLSATDTAAVSLAGCVTETLDCSLTPTAIDS